MRILCFGLEDLIVKMEVLSKLTYRSHTIGSKSQQTFIIDIANQMVGCGFFFLCINIARLCATYMCVLSHFSL